MFESIVAIGVVFLLTLFLILHYFVGKPARIATLTVGKTLNLAKVAGSRLAQWAEKAGAKIFDNQLTEGVISMTIPRDSKIAELSTVCREFDQVYLYSKKILGKEKVLILKATYLAKAGVNAGSHRKLDIHLPEPGKGELLVSGAKGEVFSCERKGDVEKLHSCGGLIGGFHHEDMLNATNALDRQAREYIEQSDIAEIAEQNFLRLIEEHVNYSEQPLLAHLDTLHRETLEYELPDWSEQWEEISVKRESRVKEE